MESLRRRHVTNQSYRQSPDNQLGTGCEVGPPISPFASVVKNPGTTVPGNAGDSSSPARSLMAVPIIETQIGQMKTKSLGTTQILPIYRLIQLIHLAFQLV